MPRLCRIRGGPASAASPVATLRVVWLRRDPPEPVIYREEVLEMIGALADIKAWTYEILQAVSPEDEEEEENS